jgi:Fis family transcriptional regulator, factor for inversion stimulation protein
MTDLCVITEQAGLSIKRSLGRVIRTMTREGLSYHEAIHRFEAAYISHVRTEQAGHLGRTAAELGMHRNTLTRTIRLLRNYEHIETGRTVALPARLFAPASTAHGLNQTSLSLDASTQLIQRHGD